jgi:hypothetical protein
MPWQDWVFFLGGFVLLAGLVPTLRGPDKPALTTSLMSAGLITLFAVTMGTLGLWLSALANASVAVAWCIIAIQTIGIVRRERHVSALAQIEHEIVEAGRPDR